MCLEGEKTERRKSEKSKENSFKNRNEKPYKYYYVLFVQRKHIFIIFLELFFYSLSNRSPPRNPKPKKIGINRHDGRKNNIAFYNSLLNRSM